MADSIRPLAPFLAPEIISKILHFAHPKLEDWSKEAEVHPEFSLLARISSDWTDEAQRRLFEGILIRKSITLLKLVLALESTPRLGPFILSLYITFKPPNPVNDAHLVFQLLSSIPNLTSFTFLDPPFDSFSQEDSTAMQLAPPLLPKLTTLHLHAGQDESWKREVFDEILINAPNVTELSLQGKASYQGPMWKSDVPAKLKKLNTGRETAILEAKIWPIVSLGLESLTVDHIEGVDSRDSFISFFEAVGPTLVEMNCDTLPAEIYPFLTVLERLDVAFLPLDHSSPPKLLLPSTLISLKISHWGFFDEETTVPIEAWSHLTQLEEIHIHYIDSTFYLNQLPPLKKITLRHCQEEDLLQSMKNLVVGEFVIGELELLDVFSVNEDGAFYEDFDNFEGEEIKKRCEELGINYTLAIEDCDDKI